jgi:hypothetical protein
LTGSRRREVRQSLYKIALRNQPKRQFEIRFSARTRSRLVAEIDGAHATSYKSFPVMGNPFDEARRIRRKLQDQEGILTWSTSPDRPHNVQRVLDCATSGGKLAIVRSARPPSATRHP